MALQELMDVIGFDDEDLDANRHGYMSKRQRVKLAHQSRLLALFNSPWKERHNNKFVKFAPVNIVLVANGLLWVLISVLMATNTSPGINADIAREITIALLPLIIIFIPSLVFGISAVIVDRKKYDRDLLKGDVAMINGHIHIDHFEREEERFFRKKAVISDRYKLSINGVSFRPSGKIWQAFSNNRYENYHIYYAPNTMTILSAEFITHQ